MTNVETPRSSWIPRLTSRKWTVLLALSLMANLLIGGMIAGSMMRGSRADRMMGASYVQLIPRSFLRELPGDRRQALMEILRNSRNDLRDLRKQHENSSLLLADALEKETFSTDEARSTINTFAKSTESLAARGGDVVMEIVSALTPEERKTLAQEIRKRAERGKRRKTP
jgi:uncharacterized membrane protein